MKSHWFTWEKNGVWCQREKKTNSAFDFLKIFFVKRLGIFLTAEMPGYVTFNIPSHTSKSIYLFDLHTFISQNVRVNFWLYLIVLTKLKNVLCDRTPSLIGFLFAFQISKLLPSIEISFSPSDSTWMHQGVVTSRVRFASRAFRKRSATLYKRRFARRSSSCWLSGSWLLRWPRPRGVSMIKTEKILHLKSSRGGKVRVVREHYLRPRVPCYSSLCRQGCENGTVTTQPQPGPQEQPARYLLVYSLLKEKQTPGLLF